MARPKNPIFPHGTLAGYLRHRREKLVIPPDDPCQCRKANAAYTADVRRVQAIRNRKRELEDKVEVR